MPYDDTKQWWQGEGREDPGFPPGETPVTLGECYRDSDCAHKPIPENAPPGSKWECLNGKCRIRLGAEPPPEDECSVATDCNAKGEPAPGKKWICDKGTCRQVVIPGGGGEPIEPTITPDFLGPTDYPFDPTGTLAKLSPEDQDFLDKIRAQIEDLWLHPGMTPEERLMRGEQLTGGVKKTYQTLKPQMMADLARRGTVESGPGLRAQKEFYQRQAGDIKTAMTQLEYEDMIRTYSNKMKALDLAERYAEGRERFALGMSSSQIAANRLALDDKLGTAGLHLQNLALSYGFQKWAAEFGFDRSKWESALNLAMQGNLNDLWAMVQQLLGILGQGYYA